MPALRDNDPLQTTLDYLRSDVERTPLADSLSVRRRGEARSRHQAVAGALVVAALVAGAFGVADLRGHERNGGIPAHTTPSPSETPVALAAQPFVRDSDLTGIGSYGPIVATGQPPQNLLQRCIDPAGTAGSAAQVKASVLYDSDQSGDGNGVETVLRFASSPDAERYATALSDAAHGCDPGNAAEVTTQDSGPEAVRDATDPAFRWSRLTTPKTNGGISYYELGVTRDANVVVVLEWMSMGNPNGDTSGEWVWTSEGMASAMNAAVAP
jgi:hypothetical protein